MIDAMIMDTNPPKADQKSKVVPRQNDLVHEAKDFKAQLKGKREEAERDKPYEDELLPRTQWAMAYHLEILEEVKVVEETLDTEQIGISDEQTPEPAEDFLEKAWHERDFELDETSQIDPGTLKGFSGALKSQGEGFEDAGTADLPKQAEVLLESPPAREPLNVYPLKNDFKIKEDVYLSDDVKEDTNITVLPKEVTLDEAGKPSGHDPEMQPEAFDDKEVLQREQSPKTHTEDQGYHKTVNLEAKYDVPLPKAPEQGNFGVLRYEVPMKPKEVFDQITEKIKFTVKGQEQEVSIRLKPDHLGEVLIKVSTDKGRLRAEFFVQNPEVKQTLQTFAQDFKGQIQEKGFDFTEISVYNMSENWQADSQNHNFAGQSQQGYHKKGRFRMGMVEDLTDDAKVQNGYDLWDSDSSVNYMV